MICAISSNTVKIITVYTLIYNNISATDIDCMSNFVSKFIADYKQWQSSLHVLIVHKIIQYEYFVLTFNNLISLSPNQRYTTTKQCLFASRSSFVKKK